jgi:mannose-6-phosphate isomerase
VPDPRPPLPPRMRPLRPVPAPSVRPWAGTRLAPHAASVGELWIAGPGSVVASGDGTETTLDELAARYGAAFVGTAGMARYGARFPLLAKLIDAADWLSLQVHPDDTLARELFGPDAVGKAEAWVVLEADDGAELIVGPADGLAEADLRRAIETGTAGREHGRVRPAVAGDVLLIRPGTLHAIGGGTFLYELQQPSDLTFRVSDWGRAGRELHPGPSLRALAPAAVAEACGSGFRLHAAGLETPELRLELAPTAMPVERRPDGRSVEVVTSLRGTLVATVGGSAERLTPYQTLVIPASVDAWRLEGPPDGLAAIGTVP